MESLKDKENVRKETVAELLMVCNSLLGQLMPALTSGKLLHILQEFYTKERESLAAVVDSCSRELDSCCSWLEWQLLVGGQLERQQAGSWQKQLAGHVLAPLVDWLPAHLSPAAETDPVLDRAVRSMVRIGDQVVQLLDGNSLRKRLHKVS
jgi:hypothetical protein